LGSSRAIYSLRFYSFNRPPILNYLSGAQVLSARLQMVGVTFVTVLSIATFLSTD
jgi:hypothetical protein